MFTVKVGGRWRDWHSLGCFKLSTVTQSSASQIRCWELVSVTAMWTSGGLTETSWNSSSSFSMLWNTNRTRENSYIRFINDSGLYTMSSVGYSFTQLGLIYCKHVSVSPSDCWFPQKTLLSVSQSLQSLPSDQIYKQEIKYETYCSSNIK